MSPRGGALAAERHPGRPRGGKPREIVEVGEDAVALAGDRCVQGLVQVVTPDRVHAMAAALGRQHEARIVAAGLAADQQARPERRAAGVHNGRQLLDERHRGVVVDDVEDHADPERG
ncbi:MAG: hypothetical protein IPM29_28925 [Planctomycetes bacterium]|nr:hypothetical protein [Planctomycetota bacterium]